MTTRGTAAGRPGAAPAARPRRARTARVVSAPALARIIAPLMDRRPSNSVPGRGTTLVSGLLVALSLAPAARAQEERSASVPDQVHVVKPRAGSIVVTGTVVADTLDGVRVEKNKQEKSYDASEVQLIVWGDVPPAFKEAEQYRKREDYENAAAKYKVAATDASAREVVQAVARLRAAEVLYRWGARDPVHFRESALEAERFLQSYPDNRAVPEARTLRARATLLSGDAAAASALYRALWEETRAGPKPGYDRLQGLEAGSSAARAMLAMGDTLAAREVYQALEGEAAGLLAELAADDPGRRVLLQIQSDAELGEGFALLAGGQTRQALSFFESRAQNLNGHSTGVLRSGLALGYAQSLLAEGRQREAQVWFARVVALEPSDRDRIAEALVGMADASRALGDTAEGLNPGRWLDEVLGTYGDTPAAQRARTMK
jgi:tetratricopeptide (TPR) repeat protein